MTIFVMLLPYIYSVRIVSAKAVHWPNIKFYYLITEYNRKTSKHWKTKTWNIYFPDKYTVSTLITAQSIFHATNTTPGQRHSQKDGISAFPCESRLFSSSTSSISILFVIIIFTFYHQDNPFEFSPLSPLTQQASQLLVKFSPYSFFHYNHL